MGDGKNLARAVGHGLARLSHDERSRENEAADFEEMAVPFLAGTRIELPMLDHGEAVGLQLLLEVQLVDVALPSKRPRCRQR